MIVSGVGKMENIKNKTVFLVETVLKETNTQVDAPRYIYGIEEAGNFFVNKIGNNSVECFYVMYMNTANELVAMSEIAKGDATNVVLSIGEVIRIGILSNAKYILLAHNHPSGVAKPSESDVEMTKKIAQAASLLNMHLVDSIIVCGNGSLYSMRKTIAK